MIIINKNASYRVNFNNPDSNPMIRTNVELASSLIFTVLIFSKTILYHKINLELY